MSSRAVHFVGSFPADGTETAMRAMLDGSAGRLRTLPTGETRRYELYVVPILDDLVTQGKLEVVRPGQWRSLIDRTVYRVPRGVEFRGDDIDLGYLREAEEAWPIFERLRAEYDRPDLALQLGMPTALTLAAIALGPKGAISRRQAFLEATVRDVAAIRELAGDDVVIQLEATAELVLTARGGPLSRSVERALRLGAGIAELAAATPAGTRIGVHLCLGSLRNKAAAAAHARPVVELANSLVRHWPENRTLEYVHAPFAAGDHAPPTGARFYRRLADLSLPVGTRFYPGLVHDAPTVAQQQATLADIEAALGAPVDGVAAPCGLGRRSRPVAEDLIARAARLAD
ncbi:hypothetical protein [Nocardia spumae]|uniref:hypothetical protein n=1 Tax=Nocardia spumae TaxID=2887190 RepID=UPI001D142D33|nr:hypothetical protein [Nocardia spumae]